MRLGILILLLGMSGCQTLDELNVLCAEGDVKACQKAIEIEAILVKRARCDMEPRCPYGYTAYRDHRHSCWTCVEQEALRRALMGQ